MDSSIGQAEGLVLNLGNSDLSKTFHWNKGDSFTTTTKVEKAAKSNAKPKYNNAHFKVSSHSNESVVEICEQHLIHKRYQKDVCEQYGISKATLQRWIQDGGLYFRAKQELGK